VISPNRYPQGEVLSYARRQNGTCKVTPNAGGGFSSLRAFPSMKRLKILTRLKFLCRKVL
jgi:hypothetical protein